MSESEYVVEDNLNLLVGAVMQVVLRVLIATRFARLSCHLQVQLVLLLTVHCAGTSA